MEHYRITIFCEGVVVYRKQRKAIVRNTEEGVTAYLEFEPISQYLYRKEYDHKNSEIWFQGQGVHIRSKNKLGKMLEILLYP